MWEYLRIEIADLQFKYRDLTRLRQETDSLVVSGVLTFEASANDRETIADIFEIDLIIPSKYPKELPCVFETGGRIRDDYEHIHKNGKLCLAVPVEERLIFDREPCLRGFVTNLVIPYCYGYCFWERNGFHPFGEREHGGSGIASFYIDRFNLKSKIQALKFVSDLLQHGFQGRLHDCPCGSGSKMYDCHWPALKELLPSLTKGMILCDVVSILEDCEAEAAKGEFKFPRQLRRKISRKVKKYFKPPMS